MAKGKRFARAVAKLYIYTQLRGQDMPEWPQSHGFFDMDSDEADEFMAELQRVAERILEQVPESMRDYRP